MNPLREYEQWKSEIYAATAGEWKEWAARIVKSFRAELKAAKNDNKRIIQLKAENEALREAIQQAVDKIYDEDDPDAAKPWLVENVLGLLVEALATEAIRKASQ